MPIPTSSQVSTLIRAQLTSAGAPGTIVLGGVSQTPLNPLHLMSDLMVQTCWPIVLTNFMSGIFFGSKGGPTAVVSPPAPLPLITLVHMQAAVAPLLPIVPTTSASIAALNMWVGPYALSVPTGVGMGVLMAFNSSNMSIAGAPGDAVFTALTGGFLEYTRTPLIPSSFIGPVHKAWASHPDLGPANRLLTAKAMVGALIEPINQLHLSCGIANVAPPAVPIVVGAPYSHSTPLVFT